MIRIYVIRHGETDGNRYGYLQGWTDQPLNEKGIQLAIITAKALADVRFDLCFSSPLRRAYQTAELLLEYNHHIKQDIIIDDRLKEIFFGQWEGLGITSKNFSIPSDDFNKFYSDPLHFKNAPGGESIKQVCSRTGQFYQELISNPNNENKNILLSMHGCSMRALLQQVYEDKADFWHGHVPYNCAVNIIEVEHDNSNLIGDDIIFYEEALCVDPYMPCVNYDKVTK